MGPGPRPREGFSVRRSFEHAAHVAAPQMILISRYVLPTYRCAVVNFARVAGAGESVAGPSREGEGYSESLRWQKARQSATPGGASQVVSSVSELW